MCRVYEEKFSDIYVNLSKLDFCLDVLILLVYFGKRLLYIVFRCLKEFDSLVFV